MRQNLASSAQSLPFFFRSGSPQLRSLRARFQKREKFWQLSTTLSHIFGSGRKREGTRGGSDYHHLYPHKQRGVMRRLRQCLMRLCASARVSQLSSGSNGLWVAPPTIMQTSAESLNLKPHFLTLVMRPCFCSYLLLAVSAAVFYPSSPFFLIRRS